MSKPKRDAEEFRIAAHEYVSAQLNVMRKYGSQPTLSVEKYEVLISKIEAIGRSLWTDSGGEIAEVPMRRRVRRETECPRKK